MNTPPDNAMMSHAPGQCNGMLCMRSLFMVVMVSWALRGPVDGPEVCIIPWASGPAGIYISPVSGRAELPPSVGQWTGRKLYIYIYRRPVDGPSCRLPWASGRAGSGHAVQGQWTGQLLWPVDRPWVCSSLASGGAESCRAFCGQQTGQTVPCEVFASFVLRGLPSRHSRRALEVWSSMLPCPMADSLSGIDVYYRNYRL